jgi:hypothetical protein
LKNAKHAKRRQNVENYLRNPLYQRNLNNAFAAAEDQEYRTPIGAIAEAALLAQQLPPKPQIQRLQYLTHRALVQLDGQHLMSLTQNTLLRPERHGDSVQVSRTTGGGFASRGNKNSQRNQDNPVNHGNRQGQQSARGNVEQEVQQPRCPPHSRHDPRPQGEIPPEASLFNVPMTDLRQKINDGHDTQCIIEARRRDRPNKYQDTDDNDRFPAFTSNITEKSYPKDFKPFGIPKYDGKQDPR